MWIPVVDSIKFGFSRTAVPAVVPNVTQMNADIARLKIRIPISECTWYSVTASYVHIIFVNEVFGWHLLNCKANETNLIIGFTLW